MAKRRQQADEPAQDGSLEVMYVKMTGSSQSIGDAIRQVTSVIRQGQVLGLPPAPANGKRIELIAPNDESDTGEHEEVQFEDDAEDAPPAPVQRRKPRKPNLVESIDLQGAEFPFAEYVQQTNPQSQLEKVLVIAGWYSEHGGIAEISVDHIYTGFKSMNWTDAPKDYRVPLSDLEHKKEFLSKGARGTWKLNHVGENEIRKMKERAAEKAVD